MPSLKPRSFIRLAAVISFLLLFTVVSTAQMDPDPNSPQPVLFTKDTSARAIASTDSRYGDPKLLTRLPDESYYPGTKIVLYAANFEFLPGEGANAVRIYAADKQGHQFRFPVLAVERIKTDGQLYAVTVLLQDEIGYWPAPENGDMLVYLTWRGLASNRVVLGYGDLGGWKSENAIAPMPLSSLSTKRAAAKSVIGRNTEYVGYRWSGDRSRFLEQATFGPTFDLDQQIRRNGIRQYLVQQFAEAYPSASNPYPSQPLKPGTAQADCDNDQTVTPDIPVTCFRDTYTMYPLQTWFHKEAFYGDAQLRHRVAWALSQIWVTSGIDIQQSRHMVEYHKVLSANAFGNFRNLMKQMTLNPTMGDYLDMARSTKTNPNENYAREIMQLFTVGLFTLNPDGTVQCVEHNPCQPGDTPVATYDQNTVNNLTKVLTGWGFCPNGNVSCPNSVTGTIDFIDPLLLNTNNHDLTAKTLLNYPGVDPANRDIPACAAPCTSVTDRTTYANASLEKAMDNIFYHPNVGPFISRTLIQHMVTSDPTPAYVLRVANVFNNNGFGVRGDLKAVVKAILLDPEARGDVKTDPNYGKLREPVQLATNFFRHFGVRSADGLTQSDGYLNGRGEYVGMGQDPYRSPTVFNYYPPDNIIPGTILPGPEFALMTTGTAVQRANFANRFVFTAIPITATAPNSPTGLSVNFADLQALAATDTTGNLLVDELNRRMMHGAMSAAMKSTILTAVGSITVSNPPTDTQTLSRVRQAVYLVTTSSQYQIQR